MFYYYKSTDKGIFGDSFEKAVKRALNRKNADKVSAQGKEDFRFRSIHYEVKQNGTVLKYHGAKNYIMGSSRVIFASHIVADIFADDFDTIGIDIDLSATEFYCVDKKAFLDFLLSQKGFVKYNAARGEYNIQSLYNYKRGVYIGRKGKMIEKWCKENALDDDIVDIIKANCD